MGCRGHQNAHGLQGTDRPQGRRRNPRLSGQHQGHEVSRTPTNSLRSPQSTRILLMHSLTRICAAGYLIMLVFAGVLAMPLTAYAQGDAAAGEKVFAHCAACHSNKPGENKFGPSLAGVFGRKNGTEPGYNYSAPMKGLNVTWDETNLDEYLQGPGKFVRGTKMDYFVP